MSFTKKRLIQERNILLERKHILEQAPTTGTTTPTPVTTTTTTIKKLNNSDLKILPDCSTIDSKIKKQSGYTTNEFIVFLTTDNKPICTTKK